jgi:class 3 adenylate cyclase
MSMVMVPFVTDDTREDWEAYSVANQGWFQEGLDVRFNLKNRELFGSVAIPEEIYAVKGLSAARELGPGPYLPQWQIAPIVNVPALVNFNLLSHSGYQDSLNALLEAKVAVVGRSFDFSDPNDEATAGRKDVFRIFLQKWEEEDVYGGDPIADLHVPLYDDYSEDTRNLVGLLTCVVYWRSYFVNILPENTNGIIVVLENTCDQKYTYQVNGPSVEYIGPGDQHDSVYDKFKMSTEEGAYLQSDDDRKRDINGSCLYRIHVYPSADFESSFVTDKPAIYTAVLVLVFLFTSAVFLAYDCYVERRQRVVMDTAIASSAIVSSLFPKVVRDRLYKGETKNESSGHGKMAQKSILQNFMSDGRGDRQITEVQQASKPIADLFQDCTVLFADISGFTAWSSAREPSDVFVLLETLYGAFDKIAKKRRVFKVETIGDCYLAVTGLPEPQEDHAIIMCLFAHECMRQMKVVMGSELKDQLGGDTSILSMRFGLHSGPVTAGVLRGEKSRFQLFGDTVNTAARMESTGKRDKIQLSKATADILVEAGKLTWIEERKDLVEAKGKGTLQTYWLRIRGTRGNRRSSNESSTGDHYEGEISRRNQVPRLSASRINGAGEVSILNGELDEFSTHHKARYPLQTSASSKDGSHDSDSDSENHADVEKRDTTNRSTGATEDSDTESTRGQEAQDGIEVQPYGATTESSNNLQPSAMQDNILVISTTPESLTGQGKENDDNELV